MGTLARKSFHFMLLFFNFAGFYDSQKTILSKIWAYTSYMFVVIFTAAMFLNLYFGKNYDNMRKNQMVLSVICGTFAAFKLSPFLIFANRMTKCIDYFESQRFAPRHVIEKEIFSNCVEVCSRNTKMYSCGLLFAVVLWCFLKFLGNELPLEIWLPYEPTSKPLLYYITFSWLSLMALYIAFLICGVEPMIGGLVYHATCQMKILKYNLQNLDGVYGIEQKFFDFLEYQRNIHKNCRRCIVHHNDILEFIDEFKKCFNFLIFSQIAGNTLCLCYCCIGLTLTPPTSKEGVLYITIYFMFSCQLLFYCFFGTLLFEENEGLIDAVYMGSWYKYDTKVKKLIMFIMERSKKPTILTAGEVLNLTLQTFTSILKTSYSLVAVMNNYH